MEQNWRERLLRGNAGRHVQGGPYSEHQPDALYLGPYRVVSSNPAGSYKLADAKGNILQRTFPRSFLKAIEADNLTDRFYVDKIVDMKHDPAGHRMFKVRWFGYDPSEDTWEPASSFDDPGLINTFLARNPHLMGE